MRAGGVFVILSLLISMSGASRANMTTAVIGAGGLVPVKIDNISIEREDLYVSPKHVSVRYLFKNPTAADIHTPILFPLPPIDVYWESGDGFNATLQSKDGPAINVNVKVAGKPMNVLLRQRAYSRDGLEVTEKLRTNKIKLLSRPGELEDSLKLIDQAAINEMARIGLIVKDDPNWGYLGNWTVVGEYIWTQVFPANSTIEVSIDYKPLTGGFFDRNIIIPNDTNTLETEKDFSVDRGYLARFPWDENYCFDKNTIKEIVNLPKDSMYEKSAYVSWTRYILNTALNWRGPIEEFNLIVDKLHPQAVLAMCQLDLKTPLRQIGTTTYEFKAKKFYPKINLSILVVDPSN
jgi:hypothetical protein